MTILCICGSIVLIKKEGEYTIKNIWRLFLIANLFFVVNVKAAEIQEYDLVSTTFNKYSYDTTQVRYLQKELRFVMGCNLTTTGNFKSVTLKCLNQFKTYYGLPTDDAGTVDNTVKSYLNYYYLVNRVIVSSTKSNIRTAPYINYNNYYSNVIGSYKQGDIVKIYGTATGSGKNWFKVKYNGVDAFIAEETITTTFVEIDIKSQVLRLFKDTELISDTPVTTGKAGSKDTNTGFHRVILKRRERILQPSGAYVRYWVRFYDPRSLGIHDADWRGMDVNYRYFGGTVYKTKGYNAGNKHTGSHGCVNVPVPKMGTIYDNIQVNTPVYVH